MSKTFTIKASKRGRTVNQQAMTQDQRNRWVALFIKNGWRVREIKALS